MRSTGKYIESEKRTELIQTTVGRDDFSSCTDMRYDYKEKYPYDLAEHIYRMNELKAMCHE